MGKEESKTDPHYDCSHEDKSSLDLNERGETQNTLNILGQTNYSGELRIGSFSCFINSPAKSEDFLS